METSLTQLKATAFILIFEIQIESQKKSAKTLDKHKAHLLIGGKL